MASVNILNVKLLKNPADFPDPLQFEITFECLCPLDEDLNWKLVYVGSAESAKYDQVLDSIMVGPVPIGVNKFLFEADAPHLDLIPPHEVRGVTVLLLICSYAEQEFIRIGYYVDNDYDDESFKETILPDAPINIKMLKRNILEDKPRVTRFNIIWDSAKLAQSKTNGGLFEMPEELLSIEESTNFEEDVISLDQDSEEEEDIDEDISSEDIGSSSEEDDQHSSEDHSIEGFIAEKYPFVNSQQIAVMDTTE